MADAQTTVTYWRPHPWGLLRALIWYKTIDGMNRWVDLLLPNNGATTVDEMMADVLRVTTGFVRDRWFLVEVTTPLRREYSEYVGGERVLQVVRRNKNELS